jgi:hypothetical protein
MRSFLGTLALLAAAMPMAALGCSGKKGQSADASSDQVTPGDGPAEQPLLNDLSCQEIRLCTWYCHDDPCLDVCEGRGSATGVALYRALRACFVGAGCSASDFFCGCAEGCYADGACLDEVAACVGTLTADIVCDENCH